MVSQCRCLYCKSAMYFPSLKHKLWIVPRVQQETRNGENIWSEASNRPHTWQQMIQGTDFCLMLWNYTWWLRLKQRVWLPGFKCFYSRLSTSTEDCMKIKLVEIIYKSFRTSTRLQTRLIPISWHYYICGPFQCSTRRFDQNSPRTNTKCPKKSL